MAGGFFWCFFKNSVIALIGIIFKSVDSSQILKSADAEFHLKNDLTILLRSFCCELSSEPLVRRPFVASISWPAENVKNVIKTYIYNFKIILSMTTSLSSSIENLSNTSSLREDYSTEKMLKIALWVRILIVQRSDTISEGDTTNTSFELHTITTHIRKTKPSIFFWKIPKKFHEAFLKPTQLTETQNENVVEKWMIH